MHKKYLGIGLKWKHTASIPRESDSARMTKGHEFVFLTDIPVKHFAKYCNKIVQVFFANLGTYLYF